MSPVSKAEAEAAQQSWFNSFIQLKGDTVQEFMNVLEVVTANLDEDQIEYADLAIQGEEY